MAAWREPKTDWADADPVSAQDFRRIEENIKHLYEDAATAKQVICAALIAMNRSVSTSSTFATLATEITNISKDANAAVGDILKSKTAYSGGVKRTGTLEAEVLV